ncbi:MAG TPA: RNA-binding S4 domain-containing protein [Burkholderiales bacterium]|nr:RNA-binding S4 domain-containing protein [Burkholderiales bacterium]
MTIGDDRTRVDKWLWAARFYKTRSIAADAVEGGKVLVNGARVKPARALRVGDELQVHTPNAMLTVHIRELSVRRGSATDAARLFIETEESKERRAEAKLLGTEPHPDAHARGRPTKRARRLIHKVRGEPL